MATSPRRSALILVLVTMVAPLAARAGASEDAVGEALRLVAGARGMEVPADTLRPEPLARAVRDFYPAATPRSVTSAAAAALRTLSPGYREALETLLPAMASAERLRDEAFAGITDAEIAATERTALRAGSAPGSVTAEEARAALEVIGRIDMARMVRAAALVTDAVRVAAPAIRAAQAPPAATCTPGGLICVGSDGDDVYTDDVQLLIDPAGDDRYENNAGGALSSQMLAATGGCVFGGGTTGTSRPNLGCSPLPSQLCTYDTANHLTGRDDLPVVGLPNHDDPAVGTHGTNGSCGSDERRDRMLADTQRIDADADSRAVTVLLDLGGSDTYAVPWSHDDPLFHLIEDCYPGEDDRRNTNRDFIQGGALAGIALTWDAGDGDDTFRGRLNSQASGHVGGIGMLVTEGTGDDLFWADRLSQGNGIAGGIGLLVNTKDGDHTYLLDPPLVYRNEFAPNGRDCVQEGRAGQGEGGFGGVGVLWSQHTGTALYRAVTHETTDAHPFAPVLDDGGAPTLAGGSDAQGSGESFPLPDTPGGLVVGIGILVDATDGAGATCPARADGTADAGMTAGSAPSTGTDLSTAGTPAGCGTFNLPAELDTGDLADALQHLSAGALGIRVIA